MLCRGRDTNKMSNKTAITSNKSTSPWACVFCESVSWCICHITCPDCSRKISPWRMLHCIWWPDVAVTLLGVSEYAQVLTLNHPPQKGQQRTLLSADSASLHHQCHWCRGFCFPSPDWLPAHYVEKSQHQAFALLCQQLLIMQWHFKPFLPL